MKEPKTHQGVRDLNALFGQPTKAAHVHRFLPSTRTDPRTGRQFTRMNCYCGEVAQENEQDKRDRELAELDAAEEREWYVQFGGGR